jgi:ACS family sodium-dependent inorganic phosphate cotransporter
LHLVQLSFGDLAPNYAGTLFGIGNSISCICGFAAPFVTGMITQDAVQTKIILSIHTISLSQSLFQSTHDTWRIVFLLSACLWILSGAIFLLFVPAEVQWWNNPNSRRTLENVEISDLPQIVVKQEEMMQPV